MRGRRPQSVGERLFAAYLRQRRLRDYAFEPVVGNAQVDFVVDHPGFGPVSWEIYEPEWRLPNQPASRDPYEPIRRGFKRRKQVQAKAAATAALPHVLVLHASRSDASFDPFIVAGAMFGNIGVTFTVDLEGGSPPGDAHDTTFLGGGRLQEGMNRSYSAVALLTRFNPTLWRVQRAYASRLRHFGLFRWANPPPWVRGVVWRIMTETHDRFRRSGIFDETAAVARLTVVHNPHAKYPLDPSIAAGPHDEQWGTVALEDRTIYCQIASGVRCYEIPGRITDLMEQRG